MRALFHALLMSAAISLTVAPSAFAQREGGREPAGVGREPAGGFSGREGRGEAGGPDRGGKEKSKSVSAEKGGEKTTINHGNGEKTTVTSDKEGSRIERHGTNESTHESHKEALDRITREAEARGEKADIQKNK
jgi:hypothetical protein